MADQPTLLPNLDNLDLKSPVFRPRPGWGGKTKKWLTANFVYHILPVISTTMFLYGVYGLIKK